MPNTRQSAKRVRQTARRTLRNQRVESSARSTLRVSAQAIRTQIQNASADPKAVAEIIKKAQTAMAKAASKGAIPAKRAARKTKRLAALARSLQHSRPVATASTKS